MKSSVDLSSWLYMEHCPWQIYNISFLLENRSIYKNWPYSRPLKKSQNISADWNNIEIMFLNHNTTNLEVNNIKTIGSQIPLCTSLEIFFLVLMNLAVDLWKVYTLSPLFCALNQSVTDVSPSERLDGKASHLYLGICVLLDMGQVEGHGAYQLIWVPWAQATDHN